jgi:Mg/Co/Ni transporter MgtE
MFTRGLLPFVFMASVNRVYAARLAGMVVLGPDGESLGRVRDVLVSISIVRQQPRVLGLVIELPTRRRIFVPILRVTAIEPDAVTLTTGNMSLRRFVQRPGEVLVLGQVLDTRVRVDDPEQEQLAGVDVVVVDLGIEQTRTRDWVVTRVAVRGHRRLGRRAAVVVVDWQNVQGLTPSGLAMPDQGVAQLLHQFEGQRPIEVADALRDLPAKRRTELIKALDDERLADILQELSEDDQSELLRQLDTERAADVLEAMDPDDAADLLGVLNPTEAEVLLRRMDPEDSEPVRRLLSHSPDTAGGLMTSDPVVLAPDTTVAEALARVRDPDLTPALASLVFVVRPPTATPTGRYLGCVHTQALLREPPANLVSGIIDADLRHLDPDTTLGAVTRYFAAYNLVCGPVLDDEGHLLGAVTVDDVLDHLLPHDWRESFEDAGTAAGNPR